MKTSLVNFMVVIVPFFTFPVFGQTVKLADLLNVKRTDSSQMKNLFGGNQFYLAKVTSEGRKTDYVYQMDSSNKIGIRVFQINDSIRQIIWVTYTFTDEQTYKELAFDLRNGEFVRLSSDIIKGFNNTKVKGYKVGDLVIILSKNDPKIMKYPYDLSIQNMQFIRVK